MNNGSTMAIFFLMLCTLGLNLHRPGAAWAEVRLKVVASEYPPYSYLEKGQALGFCTEVVQVLLKEIGSDAQITILPWARAYNTALKQENVMIFTLARTPDREESFKWAGVLVAGRSFLFSLQTNPIYLGNLTDASDHVIGAVLDDTRARYLRAQGVKNLDFATHSRMNAIKLINGRIHLWAEDELAAIHTLRQLGHDPQSTLKKALALDIQLKGYLALSKKTPEVLVEEVRSALARIKESGQYEVIRNKYILQD